jgi:hypothetical protein
MYILLINISGKIAAINRSVTLKEHSGGKLLPHSDLRGGVVLEEVSRSRKRDLQDVGGGRGDWMELAQDRDRWRALVGTVGNFRVP